MSLLPTQEVIEAHPLIQHHEQVHAIQGDEGRRVVILLKRISGETVDAQVQTEGVLTLTLNLLGEDVQVATTNRFLLPAGFEHVVIGVEAERAVNLFALQGVSDPQFEVEQPE